MLWCAMLRCAVMHCAMLCYAMIGVDAERMAAETPPMGDGGGAASATSATSAASAAEAADDTNAFAVTMWKRLIFPDASEEERLFV